MALKGIPTDGEAGVATNVRPVYDAFVADLADPTQNAHFELTSASGTVVAVAARATHTWHFELFPAAELEPLTTYTLHASWTTTIGRNPVSFTQSFTTGSGPVLAAPPPPLASLRHYRRQDLPPTSCDGARTGTCVSLDAGTLVQVNHVDEFGQEHGVYGDNGMLTGGYLYGASFFTNLSGVDQGTNFECVRLRSRGADGRLSEPVTLCGDDGPLYELAGWPTIGCTSGGLTRNGALVLASDPISAGGCTVAGEAAPSIGGWFMLAAVAAACRWPTSRRRSRS